MDFNTILLRLGFDPGSFINKLSEPIKTENGFIYEVEQRTDNRVCPHCGSNDAYIHTYRYTDINCSETDHIKDVLRIKKIRFKCRKCNKTFTPSIDGIRRSAVISSQTISMICSDFFKPVTFSFIADRYGLSAARIIQIFDENVRYVPRKQLPKVMCIDEIKFNEEIDQKYCCVLYDHEKRLIVDIIKNRRSAYLDEYFMNISEKERNGVNYFISDMYEEYATVRRKYFKSAVHIIDLFHVLTQMTNAVNRIRTIVMKRLDKRSLEYNFMKTHWRLFLCKKINIPDRFYCSRKTGTVYHYDDLLFECLLKDDNLLEAYNTLQDLFRYQELDTFSESLQFIDHISKRLILSDNDILESVGYTYRKWRIEIANGIARNQKGKHYTNGIAESLNNHLKTIIKSAYGYHNFERFRKRAMMIITYKKP